MRQLVALLLVALFACTGHHRLEAVNKLSDEGKELYAKYQQFMTTGQQETFLALATDDERREFVKQLRVEERLAKYPEHIREAIWAQDVVVGMDTAAVLLSWSTPEQREWDEEQLSRGNQVERWLYRRDGRRAQVVFANGIVTAVEREAARP